jgi:hypothetical protein
MEKMVKEDKEKKMVNKLEKKICKFVFNINCLGVWNNPKCTGKYETCEEYNRLLEKEIRRYLEEKK